MDDELDLGRYSLALRRRWRWISVGAVGGAIAGILTVLTAPVSASVELRPVTRAVDFRNAGIDESAIDVDGIVDVVSSSVSSNAFEAELEEIWQDVSVSATRRVSAGSVDTTLLISIEANNEADLVAVKQAVVSEARDLYAAEVDAAIAAVADRATRDLADVETRLESLNTELAAAGPEDQLLVEGLILQRESRESDRDRLTSQLISLSDLEQTTAQDIRVLDESDVERAAGVIIRPVLFGIAGLIAVAGVVVAGAALDRRIRTRRDLTRLGVERVVAVSETAEVATGLPDWPLERLRRAEAASSVVVVRYGDLGRVDASSGQPVVDLDRSERDAPDLVGAAAVVVLEWGVSTRDEAASVVRHAATFGASSVSAVVIGVPNEVLTRFER